MTEEKYIEPAREINLVIVDDHPLMTEGISSALVRRSGRIVIAGTASSYDSFFALLEKVTPDVAMLDIIMPGKSGIEIAVRLRKDYPEVKILMFSSDCSVQTVLDAVNAGVDGFVSKSAAPSELVAAVESVADGEAYYGKDVARMIEAISCDRGTDRKLFTRRETEIVDLCCDGLTSREIARRLNISIRTVETHKSNIFRHLNISNSVELVKVAIAMHLVQF